MRKLTFPLTAAVLIVIAATAAIATAGDDERTTATKPTTAQSQTIVEIAAGDKRFDTLVELVKSAGLAETLSGDGPVHGVRADGQGLPQGAASHAAGPGQGQGGAPTRPAFHAVSGSYEAAELIRIGSVLSLAGPQLHVRKRGRNVRVAGAKVVQADVVASNGVIHAIDRVLIPRRRSKRPSPVRVLPGTMRPPAAARRGPSSHCPAEPMYEFRAARQDVTTRRHPVMRSLDSRWENEDVAAADPRIVLVPGGFTGARMWVTWWPCSSERDRGDGRRAAHDR